MAQPHLSPSQNLPPWQKRVIGRNASEWVVRRMDCAASNYYDLVEMGHVEASRYHRASRGDWPFTMVIICCGGLGTVRSGDYRWQLAPGQALLLPPDRPHDFESSDIGWSYTILNYQPGKLFRQNISLPKIISIHAQPLEAMILAFRREYQSDQDPALLRQMLDIIQTKILRLFNPTQVSSRLDPLWKAVLEQPEFNWTIEALTKSAHLSGEHLRRTCQHDVGRSPMEQVTYLRLKLAASRLTVGNDVIDEVAHMVGFESERAFRSAFTKMFKCSPSQYRQKNRMILEELNNTSEATDRSVLGFSFFQSRLETPDYNLINNRSKPYSLPLAPFANAFFSRGDHPWFGDIPLQVPKAGIQDIHGVPFLILDEGQGPSFILMKSARLNKDSKNRKLPSRMKIPLDRYLQCVFFLHACGWGSDYGCFAYYRFVYVDKTFVEQPLIALAGTHPDETDGSKANIQDWHFSWEQMSRSYAKPHDLTANPTKESQYLYTLEWINPHPTKKLASLEIRSNPSKGTSLAVLAITVI